MDTDIGLSVNTNVNAGINIDMDPKTKADTLGRVLVCDTISKDSIELMENQGLNVDIKLGLSEEELIGIIPSYDAVIVRSATKITAPVINSSSRLKLIVRGGVGIDNIDVGTAREKNIKVVNTPDASTNSVAELTIALIFSMARSVTQADSSMKQMRWEKKALMGTEISGKTLGIIGAGRIGFSVAEKASSLGMRIIGVDHPEANPCFREAGFRMCSLEEVLAESDYITVHVPFKKGSTPIIGAKELSLMKKGACLLNMARGGAVDEVALLQALQDGTVAKAALDVWYDEPTTNKDLVQNKNVIALPHLGASTKEGQQRVSSSVAKKIIDFFCNTKLN